MAVYLSKPCGIAEVAIRLIGGLQRSGYSILGWIEAFVGDDGEHYGKVGNFSRWNKGDFEP